MAKQISEYEDLNFLDDLGLLIDNLENINNFAEALNYEFLINLYADSYKKIHNIKPPYVDKDRALQARKIIEKNKYLLI